MERFSPASFDCCWRLQLAPNASFWHKALYSGLQQVVGESGWTLSHGERSRLYIARALLQKAPLLVLDEGCTFLDPENLQLVMDYVQKNAPTLIMVAHP